MSLNKPRTHVTIMCRARNSASVWPGSKIQVSGVAARLRVSISGVSIGRGALAAEAQEVSDRRDALVLVGVGRHGQPGVVGQQRDDRVDVALLHRVRELPHQLTLAA